MKKLAELRLTDYVDITFGVPKRRCAVSLLCGFMLIVVLGTVTGVTAGIQSSNFVAVQAKAVSTQESFDTSYSKGAGTGNCCRREPRR